MADNVTYSKIVELLDNSQYLAALKKAEAQEELLTGLRVAGGQAAVKAYRETETAAKNAGKTAEAANKAQAAELSKLFGAQASYQSALLRLQETTAGLSSEQRSLNDFMRRTEEAFKAGTITASQYKDGLAAISARQAALNTAQSKIATGSKASAHGLQQLSFQLNDVITQLASGTPIAQVFAQQGGQIAQQFQMTPGLFGTLATSVSAFGTALGTVAIPFLSVAGPLLLDYRAAAEAAADGQTALNDALEAADPLYSRALNDLEKLSELRRGSMTVDERKAEIEALYGEELSTTNEALAEQIALDEAWLSTNSAARAGWQERTNNVKRLNEEMKANEERSAAGAEAAKILIDFQDEEERASQAVADAKEREAEARKRANEARREEEAAIKEALAYLAKEEAAEKKYFENLGAAQEARDRAIEASRLKELADYNAMLKAMGEADAKALAEEEARHNAAMEKRKAEDEQRVAAVESLASASSDLFGAIMESNREAAEAGSKSAQKAMLRQFEAQRAAGIGEAVINTAVAVSQAATIAPPPFNALAIAAAIATGAAQVTTIASQQPPTFTDTPDGGYRLGPGAQTVRGAANDTAILFRDPLEGFAQAVEVMARRQAPTSSPKRGGRGLLGVSVATTPVSRLLTSDVKRATRGKL